MDDRVGMGVTVIVEYWIGVGGLLLDK